MQAMPEDESDVKFWLQGYKVMQVYIPILHCLQ